jgi:hypothetical protein
VADQFLPYRFDDRYKLLWWPLGAREGKHGVTLTEDQM